MKLQDLEYPKHTVFLTQKGTTVTVTIFEGELVLYDDSVEPVKLKKVDEFLADGYSDFNWGIVNAVIDNNLTKSSAHKDAKRILREGL